jgi:hypothetical protein
MSSDPKRLFEADSEAPDALRGLLIQARGLEPTARQTARLAARLGPLLGAGIGGDTTGFTSGSGAAAAAGAAAGGSSLAGLSGGMKLAAVLAVAGGLAGGAVWLQSSEPEPAPVEIPGTERTSVPVAPVPERAPTPSEAALADQAPPAALEQEPAARAPRARELAAQPSVAAHKASEAELLERARAALKAEPGAALGLTRDHAQRFPGGVLAQEREIIAIEALSRLGRASEAAARASAFKKRYPDSPHQRKLETLSK